MEDKIVIYKAFDNQVEANLLYTLLIDAGFSCFLSGENTSNLGFLFESPLSDVLLHVFEKDVKEIDDFLIAYNQS
jgi:hypothetical protein